jgi:iron(II)-dependent oxidoreductase
MELQRAFDTLGLEPGASAEDVEAAYRRLCDDFDARIGRVTSLALRDRYAAARAELEEARTAALQATSQVAETSQVEDPGARAWAVLGLGIGASPLEVASAYVSLCEELDRELASAPTEALRRRCLEARAEIDGAYQVCAAAPLAAETASPSAVRYETQVAEEAFEAPERERPVPAPRAIQILAEPTSSLAPARRRRRRPLRRVFAATASLLFLSAGALGYAWWSDPEWVMSFKRYLPLPPAPELVEAQTGAEYLRRRVAEERRDIELRAEQTGVRLAGLEIQTESPAVPENGSPEPPRLGIELEQAQARAELAKHLHELTERHIFSSSALAEAYGHMELATELSAAGETDRAVAAYSEARAHLEATLESLDQAETALGARFEAIDARGAWLALAASAGFEPGDAVLEGGQRLVEADDLLEAGNFAAAVPELRRASQNFRTALDDGRRILASRREAFEAQQRADVGRAEPQERHVARTPTRSSESDSQLPAVSASDRAEVKLVTIPAGTFLYGCNGIIDLQCPDSEPPGRRADVAAFGIDRTEVRVSEYRNCVDSGACPAPGSGGSCNWGAPDRDEHPVNCVDWDQAAAYCTWIGKRLPSEEEWEKAARGTDGRTYPWGNESASCDVAVMTTDSGAGCGASSTAPVGSREGGRSPYGLFDMAGNVLEWTVTLHESGGGARVLRGGSWLNGPRSMRSSHREGASPTLRHEAIGFRCVQGAVVADTGSH